MFMFLADATSATTTTTVGFQYYLEMVQRIVVCVVGIGGIALFFYKGFLLPRFLKRLLLKVDKMASTSNMFMEKITPRILQGLEDNKTIPKGSLVEWSELISKAHYTIKSPKQLNDGGKLILAACGIKKIIDDNQKSFISDLDNAKLLTALDVEEKAFYVLDKHKEDAIFNPLKTYIYNNPSSDVYTCLYVGSLYLRDLYLAAHTDLK